MLEQVNQVVEQYIDAVRRNDASALPLHPDAVCEFPTNAYRGAASFRRGLDDFARIMKSIEVIRHIVDGERCVAIVDIDTVFGIIPFAEHMHVANGQIVSLRGYGDPRPMLAGRTISHLTSSSTYVTIRAGSKQAPTIVILTERSALGLAVRYRELARSAITDFDIRNLARRTGRFPQLVNHRLAAGQAHGNPVQVRMESAGAERLQHSGAAPSPWRNGVSNSADRSPARTQAVHSTPLI